MTRKDTILIAVVINAGLLAVLFTTAVIYDTGTEADRMEFASSIENKSAFVEPPSNLIASASTGDEVDNVLKYYTSSPTHQTPNVRDQQMYSIEPMPMALRSNSIDEEELSGLEPNLLQENFVEVIVKRGDVLEKIAKANQTSVGAIKQINHLDNEHLSIGQVLKIPIKQASSLPLHATTNKKIEPQADIKQEIKPDEPIYHIVKSGDNPWKIAKQYGVKYDEILRFNSLDEEKARNLKLEIVFESNKFLVKLPLLIFLVNFMNSIRWFFLNLKKM